LSLRGDTDRGCQLALVPNSAYFKAKSRPKKAQWASW